jgi:DNA-binding transcriptional LysR family regulator
LSDPEGICHAVVKGQGLGQIPGYLAAPLIRASKLKPVLLDYLSRSRTVYVCYTSRKYVAPRIRAFVDFLVERTENNPRLLLSTKEKR